MSRTKTITLYQFDELSDAAKEKARDWFREASIDDDFWHESAIDDFATQLAPLLGWAIDKPRGQRTGHAVYFSGFSSQGDGASFEGSWAASAVKGKQAAGNMPDDAKWQQIAAEYARIAAAYPDATASVKTTGRYSHSGCTEFDVFDNDESESAAYPCTDELRDEFVQLSRDLMDWLYRQLEGEYEYQNADEQIDETIRCNEYEFTADGKRA